MSPFSDPKSTPVFATPARTWSIAAVVAALVCFLLGAGVVAWRAKVRAAEQHSFAEAQAAAAGAALELQLRDGLSGVETLAAVVRQTGGGLAAFQKTAAEWLLAHPGIACLSLAPGGVVSEAVPRRGNEREIGHNLLADPALAQGAREALRTRAPTAVALLQAPAGDQRAVVCAPVFQTAPGSGESLWGFVTAAVRLRDALAAARLQELSRRGYDYLLFVPGQGQQKPSILSSHGGGSFRAAPQRAVRLPNLEFRLAVRPQGPAVAEVALGLGAAIVLAVLAGLLVQGLSGRNQSQLARQAQDRCARIEADLKRAQEENRVVRERLDAELKELAKARDARGQAEMLAADLRTRLEEDSRRSEKAQAAAESTLRLQQTRLAELQAQLEAGAREAQENARTKAAEVEEWHKQLGQMRKRSAEVEAKMTAEIRAEREAAAELRALVEQQRSASADLQSRLDAASRAAGQAEARVEELTALLKKAPKPEERRRNGPVTPAPASPPTPVPPVEIVQPESPTKPVEAELASQAVDSSKLSAGQTPTREIATPTPAAPVAATEGPAEEAAPVDPVRAARLVVQKPVAETGAEKPVKRKKPRRDGQMDFFISPPSEEGGQAEPVTVAPGPASAVQTAREEAAGAPAKVLPEVRPVPGQEKEETAPRAAEGGDQTGEKPELRARAPADLPAIDGVDTAGGLASAGGDAKAYLRALDRFVEQHAASGRKIRDALVQSDLTDAERKLRGLKLAAAEVGATSVQNAAVAVSRTLQDRNDPTEVEFAWAELEKVLGSLVGQLRHLLAPGEEKPAPARKLPPPPPVNPSLLRKAVNEILPLFTGQDPGAKDCLKANRNTFRSAFSPDGYVEFEQLVRGGKYETALEQLKKAVKRHGLTV